MKNYVFSMTVVFAFLLVIGFNGLSFSGEAQQPAAGQQQQQRSITQAELFTLMAGEAEKGNKAAILQLGIMYERGVGTPRNYIKALEWYTKAAQAGVPEGYYNVGVAYEIGMGNSGNAVQAFQNFEKSAELGLAQGLYKLASLYFTGYGTGKNEPWGVELLTRAANAGHMAAANDLGVIYFEGRFGLTKDTSKALEMFNRAAELGNAEAMKNMAIFYRDGLSVDRDPTEELKWYSLAQRAGFPAQALAPSIEKVTSSLTPDQIKAVEEEVAKWVTDFQQRHAQAQAQQQAAQQRQQ